MTKKLRCYIRPYRRRWAMSQIDLARLLGIESSSAVSRIECGQVLPTLRAALALEVLLGQPIREMFPNLFDEIEEETVTRAYELYESLQGSSSRATNRKLDFFEEVFNRAKSRGKSPDA